MSDKHKWEADKLARRLLGHAAFQQNFGHYLCHDPQCKVCDAGAIIIQECLGLADLLSDRDERDELKNQLQAESWRADAAEKVSDELRAQNEALMESAKQRAMWND